MLQYKTLKVKTCLHRLSQTNMPYNKDNWIKTTCLFFRLAESTFFSASLK